MATYSTLGLARKVLSGDKTGSSEGDNGVLHFDSLEGETLIVAKD